MAAQNWGMAVERVVAKIRVPKLREAATDSGIGASVAVHLDARNEHRTNGVVDLGSGLGLLAEVAPAIAKRDEPRSLGLRGAACNALVLDDIKWAGDVFRIPRLFGHVERIDRETARDTP
jgi:hypothetical protein